MEPIFVGPLAVWIHPPHRSPKGRVLLVHGISEHSGRHNNTIKYLTENDWEVVRFDLRGAGRSGGKRQWIQRFDDYVEDVSQVFNWMIRSFGPLPNFVLGHSLGGAVATNFAAIYQKELSGLILSAPAYQLGNSYSPIQLALGRMIAQIAPSLRMPPSTGEWLSRDPQVIQQYIDDPLCYRAKTVKQGTEVLRALKFLPDRCRLITCPVLIVHGSEDRVIQPAGSKLLMQAFASEDKTLHLMPGGYHEPHNDLDKENFFSILDEWLENRLPANKQTPATDPASGLCA